MNDDGPVFGADPDREREEPVSGVTATTWFSRYFDEAWERVEPQRRENELNWPTKPWSIGKKTAFMGWAKNTLLPGYRGHLPLVAAMVDEFCANHERYFSPYSQTPVWKQFNAKLDRLRKNVLTDRPDLQPEQSEQPDDAAMRRHKERQERWAAERKPIAPGASRVNQFKD